MAGAFVLNRVAILDRLGGDEEIYAMMVDVFLQDVENNCRALSDALLSGDGPALQREVHAIKGLLATFSDDEGAAEAFAIEQKVKDGSLPVSEEEVLAVQVRLREVAAVLADARQGEPGRRT